MKEHEMYSTLREDEVRSKGEKFNIISKNLAAYSILECHRAFHFPAPSTFLFAFVPYQTSTRAGIKFLLVQVLQQLLRPDPRPVIVRGGAGPAHAPPTAAATPL